jgi:aspartyl-tRNA(Asn)/glutamyl-tRNA(Gln) amidotransferase subunit C
MSIDLKTVSRIANLARLSLSEEEKIFHQQKLNDIMKFIEQLGAVDTTGIEPLASVMEFPLPLRDDIVNDGNRVEDILANAPESLEGFFVVPKVVE